MSFKKIKLSEIWSHSKWQINVKYNKRKIRMKDIENKNVCNISYFLKYMW